MKLIDIVFESVVDINESRGKTKEDFIKAAENVHGKGRYDYSNVNYNGVKGKVEIICHKKDENGNEHGPFMQTPDNHVNSRRGCPKCGRINTNLKNTKNTNQFITQAKNVHGNDRYDYRNVNYVSTKTPVEIICHRKDEDGNEHGSFMQTPDAHLSGHGCKKCAGILKGDNTTFINSSEKVHDKGRYDYRNVNYVNNNTPVEIICHRKDEDGNEHGPFMQRPKDHIKGQGCPKCNKPDSINTEEFIRRSEEKHGKGRYDYSHVNYVNGHSKVEIICHKKDKEGNEHGPFMQEAKSHMLGAGCPICSGVKKKNTEEFIKLAKKVHGENRYDYSDTDYKNAKTNVIIICHKKDKNGKEHGPFLQTPDNHINSKQGCPICSESQGEKIISSLLDENNIKYIPQHKFKDCYSIVKSSVNKICKELSFDYYLPDLNTLIEFDGVFHFKKHHKDTNNSFMLGVLNDREKNNYTKLKGIKLIRISYLDRNNIVDEIISGLKSKEQLYLSTNYPKDKGWGDDSFQPTTKFVKKYT